MDSNAIGELILVICFTLVLSLLGGLGTLSVSKPMTLSFFVYSRGSFALGLSSYIYPIVLKKHLLKLGREFSNMPGNLPLGYAAAMRLFS